MSCIAHCRSLHLSALALLYLGLVTGSGCSDDGQATDAAVDAGVDAGDLGDDGPVKGTLAVKVISQEGIYWSYNLTTTANPYWLAETNKPLSGATVAADLPVGKRVELTTDADGNVTFTDVDWSRGVANLTGYGKGHALRSLLGITEADGEQTLYLLRSKTPPKTITVTGSLKNADSAANGFMVGSTLWGDVYQGSSTSFSMTVEAGKPFTLYAYQQKLTTTPGTREYNREFLGVTKADHPASTGSVTLDLDFADTNNAVALTTVKGTMAMPTSAASYVGKGGVPRFWSSKRYTGSLLGGCTKTTEETDNKFAYEGKYFEIGTGTDVQTIYYASVGSGGLASYIETLGYPKEGDTITGFLDVPIMLWPTSKIPLTPRFETMFWKNPEPKAIPTIRLWHASEPRAAWYVDGKPGATSITVPELPSSATASEVFGTTGEVYARLILCGDLDAAKQWCPRHANGTLFKIQAEPAKTVTIELRFLDNQTTQPVEGVKTCVLDHPSIPCVNSDAAGTVTLKDVPNDIDVMLTAEKSGYLTAGMHHGANSVDSVVLGVPLWLGNIWLSTRSKHENELGSTLDPKLGHTFVFVVPGPDGASGATLKIEPAAGNGPYYYDAFKLDKTLKATGSSGAGGFFNVPPGDYNLTVSKPNATCFIVTGDGWKSETATARVKVLADTGTGISVMCL